jgi:hypothetical protein
MTETSLVPLALEAAGLEAPEVYAKLATHAANRGARTSVETVAEA